MSSRMQRAGIRFSACCGLIVAVWFAPRVLVSQERGAIALGEAVLGLGVNTRVLMVGAHPDDEDTFLIAWLSRGRHVKTAYLSLTRGDGGQNLIGNELGEALGVIRTEELLAARRIDGASQYFTRAYDFGFSKDTVDTYRHWPKDTILGDVIRVVREFKPHVIVAVFSGTPRDGHGQHQVSGLLAREAYDLAGDTARFPVASHGIAWTPLKFYRAARGSITQGTVGVDVGEYSPLLGRSYAEIAGESRSQHRSQGFGAPQRKGPVANYVRREATRVNESMPAANEQSMFDGIDTTWARFRSNVAERSGPTLSVLPAAFERAKLALDPLAPEKLKLPLLEVAKLLDVLCPTIGFNPCVEPRTAAQRRLSYAADLAGSTREAQYRLWQAMKLSSGMTVDAVAPVELAQVGKPARVFSTVYNRGRDTMWVSNGAIMGSRTGSISRRRMLPPGGVLRDTLETTLDSITQPWWLADGRRGSLFVRTAPALPELYRSLKPEVYYLVDFGAGFGPGAFPLQEQVVFRFVDDIRGERNTALAAAPAIQVTLDRYTRYTRANVPFDHAMSVHLRSTDTLKREARVSLVLPTGLRADSATRVVRLDGSQTSQTITFRVRGRLGPGAFRILARAESNGETFLVGSDLVDYEHIRRQRIYRPAEIRVSSVDVRVPPALRVGYISGVGDNVAPTLTQLDIPVTIIPAGDLARTPLTRFTTLVIGPRAYEAHPELVAANARILEFARGGGTVVVQYGQYEMTRAGLMPYPITIARPHDRVTHEDAPVTLLQPTAPELTTPNRITTADFEGWIQERSLYMPRTFDERYRPLFSVADPGEPPNRGAVLIAPVGAGLYIYTTLAFFRQLPAGVPGAARLFVNLLSAGTTANRPVR